MIGKSFLNYKILDKLGEGGMGVVYLAEDTKLKRQVAIKFLPKHISANTVERKRFEIEAQAAAALNHPNIATIHAIEETQAEIFLVMEYIEGRELKEFIRDRDSSLPVEEVINIATQIAKGLQTAHEKGIIHRDIKSANIMVNKKGQAKIMDFGLAKVGKGIQLTKEQSTLGTAPYMSPEQIRGDEVDQRSDIWSFGVVLYEMLTGKMPFKGDYEQAVTYAIINEDPGQMEKNVPEELREIISHALEKDPEKRFQSVGQILNQLQNLHETEGVLATKPVNIKLFVGLIRKPWIAVAGFAVITLIILMVLIPYYQLIKHQQAKELLPQIETRIKERKYFEAYQLAKEAENYLKEDSAFINLIPGYADYLTVISNPEGARIYLKRFAPEREEDFLQREYVGLTPVNEIQVIRGGYKIFLEKEGFVPAERVFVSEYAVEAAKRPTDIFVEIKLLEMEKKVDEMVFVPRGKYKLVGWDAPTLAEIELDDYYIDKYEVSNSIFKTFIDRGGYSKKQYWKYPFIKDGKNLSWQEGIQQFTDRTGLPGPRGWINQEYPEGKGNHPVTNITWYEAAAYAEFVGKKLPTIFEWEKAVRNGEYHVYDIVMPWGLNNPNENVLHRANFEGNGTVAVDSFEFGISPFGCYNMAGNVKEWCLNEITGGFATTGGSWEDPIYAFAHFGAYPGFYSSNSLGFRCARRAGEVRGDQGNMKINIEEKIPVYKPVNEGTFKSFLTHFKYDKRTLDAKLIKTEKSANWTKEKVTFSGLDDERIIAYLFLPTNAAKPYQCLNWVPHGGVMDGSQFVDDAAIHAFAPQVKSGRALFAIVPKGGRERPRDPAYTWPDIETVKYRELVIHYATEFSLGLDYLEIRDDIDIDRLAYIGTSWGSAGQGIIFAAVENRYRSVIFIAGGIGAYNVEKLPEVNPINFAPYIKVPKLLLNGRYDEAFPPETEALPFYRLMGEPKQLSLVDAGHVPPIEKRVPIINKWLDETLGPVKFED
jgi:formylglycine-generating enzyme required for sulfatase activity/predicted Ser/Thr protein kinase